MSAATGRVLLASALIVCTLPGVVFAQSAFEPPTVKDAGTLRNYKVTMRSLHGRSDGYNDIDRWLLDMARSDGIVAALDRRDFLRGMPESSVNGLLTAARRYVQRRWIRGQRGAEVVTAFLDEIAQLELPPRYTVMMVYGNSDIAGLRRGHLVGSVAYLWGWASNVVQDIALDWNLNGRWIGGESLWPWFADPYRGRWPLLFLGVGVAGARAEGRLNDATKGTHLGNVRFFGFRLLLSAHLRFAVSQSVTLKASGGTGFGVGTLRVFPVYGEEAFEDPCTMSLAKLDEASQAVRCTIMTSLGFYDTVPMRFSVGMQLWGTFNIDFLWSREPLATADEQFSPPNLDMLAVQLGLNIY